MCHFEFTTDQSVRLWPIHQNNVYSLIYGPFLNKATKKKNDPVSIIQGDKN